MGRKFKHLTYSDRLTIERMLLQNKFSKQDIADAIGCSLRTIYYEIKRATYVHTNTDLTTEIRYAPEIAHANYMEALKAKGRTPKLVRNLEFKKYVETMIVQYKYSPEAVLLGIKEDGLYFDEMVFSHTTLYTGIKRGYFENLSMVDLPRHGKSNKRKKKKVVQKRIAPGTSIEKRDRIVLGRETFGNWEMDSVVGKSTNRKTALALTERKTRYEIIEVLKSHTADEVAKALNRIEKRLGARFYLVFKTITVDNGSEFKDFEGLEKAINRVGKRTKVYYCHARAPQERGSNENANLLIRRWLPKGADFDKILTRDKVKTVEEWINFYPRRLFKGKCSYVLFEEELAKLR